MHNGQAQGGNAAPAPFRRKRTLAESRETRDGVALVVARAQRGDRDAVAELYETYADNVYGYVCSIVRDEHEAEDVTQQVFAKLLIVVGRYRRQSVPFAAWLLRIAHNAAIDHVRNRRQVPAGEVRSVNEPADDRCFHGRTCLRDALGELPEDQRRVVVMRHVLGLSPGEIAERLGKSENAVHGLHHRGRRALRAQLVSMGSAPTTLAA